MEYQNDRLIEKLEELGFVNSNSNAHCENLIFALQNYKNSEARDYLQTGIMLTMLTMQGCVERKIVLESFRDLLVEAINDNIKDYDGNTLYVDIEAINRIIIRLLRDDYTDLIWDISHLSETIGKEFRKRIADTFEYSFETKLNVQLVKEFIQANSITNYIPVGGIVTNSNKLKVLLQFNVVNPELLREVFYADLTTALQINWSWNISIDNLFKVFKLISSSIPSTLWQQDFYAINFLNELHPAIKFIDCEFDKLMHK